MEKYYLGLDQGTTGTTALIFDSQWNQIARGYKEHTQYYPEPGWVEHDPMEIWNSILETIAMAAEEAGIQVADLTCMGLDNQGETVMLWDRYTGVPVYNAIVWQDRPLCLMKKIIIWCGTMRRWTIRQCGCSLTCFAITARVMTA